MTAEAISSVTDIDRRQSDHQGDPSDRSDSASHLMAEGRRYSQAKLYADAEASFRQAIELKPDFAAAYNNLGWARQMLGDSQGAESSYRQALQLDPSLRTVRKNLLMLLVRSGRREESYQVWHDEVRSGGDPTGFIEDQLARSLQEHEIHLAGEYAALLAAFRWGSTSYPNYPGDTSPPVFLNAEQVFLTVPKLEHDLEQFLYLQREQIVGDEFTPIMAAYQQLIDEMKAGGLAAPVPLDDEIRARIGHVFNRITHLRHTPRVSRALSHQWDRAKVETDYLNENSGVAVVDDFLSEEALESLRLFCLESTVWSGNRYNHGRLGAFFRDGFNCPLLIQIAEELRDALPRVIGRRYPLQQLWGFKTGQTLPADSTTHADFAAVNVNFWITPADANLDDQSGGLVVYDVQAPLSWDFNTYNGKLSVIRSYLHRQKADSVRIPYKQNRAIIFNSDLFHATEAVHFRPGYENHRINVTMLYGFRQNDADHLDERIDQTSSSACIGSVGWRSAAFGRVGH